MSDFHQILQSRRVNYHFEQDRPVPDDTLWKILEAARWAPTGGNVRVHRYLCLTDRKLIRQIKLLSPGFVASLPAALIVICIETSLTGEKTIEPVFYNYIDVGTAAQNMLLTAHTLGIASGIITSFARECLQTLCNMPSTWSPEMIIPLGYRGDPPADAIQWPKSKIRIQDLVQWGAFPDQTQGS